MDETAEARLHRLLGGEALANLRRRLRGRFERGATGAFRLTGLTAFEREALAGMLGRPPRRADSMSLDTIELDAALRRAGLATSLRDALERLDGPIAEVAAEREALRAQWHGLRQRCCETRLAAWLERGQSMALVKRLARHPAAAATLLDRVQTVLRALPAAGVARSRLAAEVLGDAHGLDAGRPVATLVLSVLRSERGDGNDAGDDDARDLWAAAGVLVNELARPALFVNLSDTERSFPAGEPAYISLRRLLRAPPRWDVAGRDVFVCENPNLLAIVADTLGTRAKPLVCTEGMPAAAQRTLLGQLVSVGARLHYHGDFDWPGLTIGNHMICAYGARPWRFGVTDYLAAVKSVGGRGRALGSADVEAHWDDGLAPAMRRQDLAIDEEAVAMVISTDLEA